MTPLTEEDKCLIQLAIALQIRGLSEEQMIDEHADTIRKNLAPDALPEEMTEAEVEAAVREAAEGSIAEAFALRDRLVGQIMEWKLEGRGDEEIVADVVAATDLPAEIAEGMVAGTGKGVEQAIEESVGAGVDAAIHRFRDEQPAAGIGWLAVVGRAKAVAIFTVAVSVFSFGCSYLSPKEEYVYLAILEPLFDAFGHRGLAFGMMGASLFLAWLGWGTWRRAGL